jgi:uncharacterized protein (TIRG00374 family)
MNRVSQLARKLMRFAGPVLFLLILWRIDLSRLADTVAAIRPPLVLAALLLYPCLILLKAWRWRLLLRQQGVNYSLAPAFAAYNSSLAVGYVTPGRLGEFVKALYLRQDEGLSIGYAFSSVLLDRILDLYLLLLTAGLGIVLLTAPGQLLAPSLLVLAAVALAPLLVLVPRVSRRLTTLVTRATSRLMGGNLGEQLNRSLDGFQRGMEQLVNVQLVPPLICTAIAYLVFYFQCYLCALALQLPVSYLYAAYCVSLASLLALLPVSISGLGVREAAFIALLSPLAIAAETAVTYSLLILFVFNIFGGALGALAWVLRPLR